MTTLKRGLSISHGFEMFHILYANHMNCKPQLFAKSCLSLLIVPCQNNIVVQRPFLNQNTQMKTGQHYGPPTTITTRWSHSHHIMVCVCRLPDTAPWAHAQTPHFCLSPHMQFLTLNLLLSCLNLSEPLPEH